MGDLVQYVVGFLFNQGSVLLVRKLHPAWQVGLLNGVGGHVEKGESFGHAMVREFKEETGRHVDSWVHFATLGGEDWAMCCYRAQGSLSGLHGIPNDVGETLEVVRVANVVAGSHGTIPNLRWLVPMADPHLSHDWPYRIAERAVR